MTTPKKFHFIGIGGIGMSALARLTKHRQYLVSGSDSNRNEQVQFLEEEGIQVFDQKLFEKSFCSKTTIVYSTAIKTDHPELNRAKALGCEVWHRSKLLNFLLQETQSLAVSGTHGKTSTSALLTHVLQSAQRDPSYVIGGLLKSNRTNSGLGTQPYFVLEADESDGTLIHYHPTGGICTNIEADHLDYHYRDLHHIIEIFTQFIDQVKESHLFFWCKDCPQLKKLNPKGFSYGFDPDSDLRIYDYVQRQNQCFFSIDFQGKKITSIQLNQMGRQNVLNAAAVIGLSLQLGLEVTEIKKGLKTFEGIHRRADLIGKHQNVFFFDDYGHHPTEIDCTLKGFRQAFPKNRLIAVFQPHRYSRIEHFEEAFTKCFKKASEVWLLDVYSAGENPIENFSMDEFRENIQKYSHIPVHRVQESHLGEAFKKHLLPHDVVVGFGAGSISLSLKKGFEKFKTIEKKLKVAILFGGQSPEHYISKISKNYITEGLDQKLYEKELFYVDLDGRFSQAPSYSSTDEVLPTPIFEALKKCDFVFPVFHGPSGEDGLIHAFLKLLKVPYAGSDFKSSSLCMNKYWTKQIVSKVGIKTGQNFCYTQKEWRESASRKIKQIESALKYPLVVKPNHLGSSIAISFVHSKEELLKAVEDVFQVDDEVLFEEKVKGREFEICLLEGHILYDPAPGEILSSKRQYDYVAKYSRDPIIKLAKAEMSLSSIDRCKQMAKKAYRALRLNSFVRFDFFITPSGEIIFGEANPFPGLTPKSLFPRMLDAHGVSQQEVVDAMVLHGLYEHRLRQKKIETYTQVTRALEHVTQ